MTEDQKAKIQRLIVAAEAMIKYDNKKGGILLIVPEPMELRDAIPGAKLAISPLYADPVKDMEIIRLRKALEWYHEFACTTGIHHDCGRKAAEALGVPFNP